MDKVNFLGYTFSDVDKTLYRGAQAWTYFSPVGEELRAAYYKIPIVYTPRIYQQAADDFARVGETYYGAPVYVYDNKAQTRFFYLTAITGGTKLQGGRYLFYLEGTDLAGLCAAYEHEGNIYTSSNFGTILSSILKSENYTPDGDGHIYIEMPGHGYVAPCVIVDSSLYSSKVTGWLPYTDKAIDNLRTLLQVMGAIITTTTAKRNVVPGQEPDLVPYITLAKDQAVRTISPYKTYAGDEYGPARRVKSVSVIEHSYLALNSVEEETLYEEAGTANRKKILFDAPYHSLTASGLTINVSRANYAIVSGGPGTLTGKPYVDATRVLTEDVGTAPGDDILADNTLADSLRSQGLLDRLVNYYEHAQDLKSDFTAEDAIVAGSPVIVNDPLNNNTFSYIEEQAATFSGINKLANRLAAGWQPISGNVFTQRVMMTESGVLTVPDGATMMRLILIQGGKGGWGGYPGGAGSNEQPFIGGDGGAAGEGGEAGKVNIIDISGASLAASYTVTVGQAGSPGAADHGAGTAGTHSTATDGVTTWSSNSGAVPAYGYQDPMTGEVYATQGPNGVYAGKPGAGSNHAAESLTDTLTGLTGTTTWKAGATNTDRHGGGGGGGAAYGADGHDADYNDGGDGGSAALDGFNGYTAPIGSYGSGGIGGNGGGGGGGIRDLTYGFAGGGGHGSPGGPPGAGLVEALFAFGGSPSPVPEPNWLLTADYQPLYDYDYERLAAQEE